MHEYELLSNFNNPGASVFPNAAGSLRPETEEYEFSKIREDYEYLEKHGKKLFVQLQDATFSPQFKAVSDYLLTKEYDGGITPQLNDQEEYVLGKPGALLYGERAAMPS